MPSLYFCDGPAKGHKDTWATDPPTVFEWALPPEAPSGATVAPEAEYSGPLPIRVVRYRCRHRVNMGGRIIYHYYVEE